MEKDYSLVSEFCSSGDTSLVRKMHPKTQKFFLDAARYAVNVKSKNIDIVQLKIAFKVIYLLDPSIYRVIDNYTNTILSSNPFANAEISVNEAFQFGFLTPELRDQYLEKIRGNRQMLIEETAYMMKHHAYRSWGGEIIQIDSPTALTEAIFSLSKFSSELKSITGVPTQIYNPLQTQDRLRMKAYCREHSLEDCSPPCKKVKGAFGKMICDFPKKS